MLPAILRSMHIIVFWLIRADRQAEKRVMCQNEGERECVRTLKNNNEDHNKAAKTN